MHICCWMSSRAVPGVSSGVLQLFLAVLRACTCGRYASTHVVQLSAQVTTMSCVLNQGCPTPSSTHESYSFVTVLDCWDGSLSSEDGDNVQHASQLSYCRQLHLACSFSINMLHGKDAVSSCMRQAIWDHPSYVAPAPPASAPLRHVFPHLFEPSAIHAADECQC